MLLVLLVIGEVFTGSALYRQQAYPRRPTAWRSSSASSGSLTVDGFSIFFNWIFLIAA